MREPQYSAWCFTFYYESEEEFKLILAFEKFKYVIFGEEVCPTTGRNHLQGYFELFKKQGKKTLLIDICNYNVSLKDISLQPRKGSQEQAVNYCKKDGKVHEKGKAARPGSRTDLDFVRTDALNNGMRQVTRTANAQGIRVSEKFLTYNEPARKWNDGEKLYTVHIHGGSGTGKTFKAFELAGDDFYLYNPGIMGKWWEGYDGQETVIIDDVRPEHFRSATEILTLLHEFPTRVEQKGGSRQLKAKRIILTSVLSPEEFWTFPNEPFEQYRRRLTEVIEIRGSHRAECNFGPKYTLIENEQKVSEQEVGGNTVEVHELPNPDNLITEEENNIVAVKFTDDCPFCEGGHPLNYYCKGQQLYDSNVITCSDRDESDKEFELLYIQSMYESSLANEMYKRSHKRDWFKNLWVKTPGSTRRQKRLARGES